MRFSYLHFFTDLSICRQVCGVRSFDNISYTYDENGIRASKTADGITTEYYLDGTRLIEQSNGTDTLHFNYDRNGEAIGFTHFYLSTGYDDPTMCEYIYVKNAQGDVVGIYNSLGDLKVSYTYDPWGKLLSVESDFDQYERDISLLNPFRYRGYYYDDETGLYYLQSRYYDPETGRFLNADDVDYLGATKTLLSYNAFAYCENDVVNMVDPSGNIGVTITVGSTVTIYVILKTAVAFISGIFAIVIANYMRKNGYFDYLIDVVKHYVDVLSFTAKSAINQLKDTINNSINKAKKRAKTLNTQYHYIIPQKANMTRAARKVWVNKMKYSINDPIKMIYLNYNLHKVMHTKVYYESINTIICSSYNRKKDQGVLTAMLLIRSLLRVANEAINMGS